MSKFTKVGEYKKEYNDLLGINFKLLPIVSTKGLKDHLIKRKHFDAIKHIDDLNDILANPDYVALSATTPNSILVIKKLDKNITVAIKLNNTGDKYFVATMYGITNLKVDRNVHSGNYKPLTKNGDKDIINKES